MLLPVVKGRLSVRYKVWRRCLNTPVARWIRSTTDGVSSLHSGLRVKGWCHSSCRARPLAAELLLLSAHTVFEMSIPPTPVEIRLIDAIFSVEDPQRSGFISRGRRIEVFGGSRLPLNILENIWTLIELGNDGFLTRNDTAIALRLIGWAQAGRSPSRELAEKREQGVT